MKYNKDNGREKLPLFRFLPPWSVSVAPDGETIVKDADGGLVPKIHLQDYTLDGFQLDGFAEWFHQYVEFLASDNQQGLMSGMTVRDNFPMWVSRFFGRNADKMGSYGAEVGRRFPDLQFSMMASSISIRLG